MLFHPHIQFFFPFYLRITLMDITLWASLIAQLVKNSPAMQETLVQFLGQEDPLEKGKAPTPVCWPGEFPGLYSPSL